MHNLFNSSKYTRWYFSIIENAKSRGLIKPNKTSPEWIYYESHHVWPTKLGGPDVDSNKALLTAKEHFIVHCLLPRMCLNGYHRRKMNRAINRMRNECRSSCSALYAREKIRINREGLSEETKQKLSEARRGVPLTEEWKTNISLGMLGKVRGPYRPSEKISQAKMGVKLSEEHRKSISEGMRGRKRGKMKPSDKVRGGAKSCSFKAPDGVIHHADSIAKLANANGLSPAMMRDVHKGVKLQHRGWTLP